MMEICAVYCFRGLAINLEHSAENFFADHVFLLAYVIVIIISKKCFASCFRLESNP